MKTIRKITAIILFINLCLTNISFVSADTMTAPDVVQDIIYLDDGMYIVTTLETSGVSTLGVVGAVSGEKTGDVYSSDGKLVCTFTISATFRYEKGKSATCTTVSHSHSIKDTKWNITDETSYISGATAYGSATAKKTVLSVTVATQIVDIQITCDSSGTLH